MQLNWEKMGGLIPAIVQDVRTREVLMLGYMSPESLERTRESGKVTFFSRSRQALWTKGETSGNVFQVVELQPDCDGDAILMLVQPAGPACHRGTRSCFLTERGAGSLSELGELIRARMEQRPTGSYVTKLAEEGLDRMAQKVGEEAIETVIASKNPDRGAFEGEAADLLFHLMVLLRARGSSLEVVEGLLRCRHQKPKKN